MRLLIASAACAAAAGQVVLRTNLAGAPQPLQDFMLSSVGSGHAALALRQDYREQMAAQHVDIPFRQVRFHGVFDDDMSTYLNGQVNMANVFSVYDFLLQTGVRPLLEMSFMPEELASNASATVFHYKGGISSPANWTAWSGFIGNFVGALTDRYGAGELAQWNLEVWNEPQCGFYQPYGDPGATSCCGAGCGNFTAYMQLYAATAAAVKAVNPAYRVGGPATAQVGWVSEFIQAAQAAGLPVDFVSTHLYPTDPNVPQTRDGFASVVAGAAAQAAQAGLPLLMTEFNSGLGINEADEQYSAAFVIHNWLALQGVQNLQALSYWTFSDVFEEQGYPSAPFSQGFGIETTTGVPKPVYRAFQLMAAFPAAATPASVISSGGQSVVNRTGSVTAGTVDAVFGLSADGRSAVALLTNYDVHPVATPSQTVTLQFTGLPLLPGAALPTTAQVSLIDSTHCNPKAVWIAAGSPPYPTAAETALEIAASQLQPQLVPLVQPQHRDRWRCRG